MWLQRHVNMFALDWRKGFQRNHMRSLGRWREDLWSRPFLLKRLSFGLRASSLFFVEGKICRISGNGQEAFFCWMSYDVGAAGALGATVSEFFHKPSATGI